MHHFEQMQASAARLTQRRRQGTRLGPWIALTTLAVISFLVAFFLFGPSSPGWVSFQNALALFPSGLPSHSASDGRHPAMVVAKYGAALVSLFMATFKVLRAVFADGINDLRARTRRGHAVVCGLGATGLRSTQALLADRYRVTCLESDPQSAGVQEARASGALVLRRDFTSVASLEAAGVHRAAYVVCAGPDDATNARVAVATARLAEANQETVGPNVHVGIDNTDLSQLLRAPLASVGNVRLHFFSEAQVWARALLDDALGPFVRPQPEDLTIAVIGDTELGLAVTVGAARTWHNAHGPEINDRHLTITLVGPNAEERCAALAERYPAIPRVATLVPVTHSFAGGHMISTDVFSTAAGRPKTLYVCLNDGSANLALALDLEQRLGNSTVVLLPASDTAEPLGALLQGVGRIRPVLLRDDADALDLLHDQMREALAHDVHNAYLASRAGQPDFGRKHNELAWERISPAARQASRAHVDGIIDQLQATWHQVEPLYDWDEPHLVLSAPAVEAMAELEHLRWVAATRAAGYRPGPARDETEKRHELLVPWSELPEDAREIDREMVRRRPAILANAGFRVAYDPVRETLAQRHHERYVKGFNSSGEDRPLAVAWAKLTEPGRERNRSAIDDIPLKLATIGRRATPFSLTTGRSVGFTDLQVEALARLEHDRWWSERLSLGWSAGPRDDDAGLHPSLVPWDELPEPEREIDRVLVREIPISSPRSATPSRARSVDRRVGTGTSAHPDCLELCHESR